MSLDISLYGTQKTICPHCQKEISVRSGEVVFDANITHNLNRMAHEAGFYEALWHPSEAGIKTASDLLLKLEPGLKDMIERPDHYIQFNAPNGWGKYEHFIPWLERLAQACRQYPDAEIEVSI